MWNSGARPDAANVTYEDLLVEFKKDCNADGIKQSPPHPPHVYVTEDPPRPSASEKKGQAAH